MLKAIKTLCFILCLVGTHTTAAAATTFEQLAESEKPVTVSGDDWLFLTREIKHLAIDQIAFNEKYAPGTCITNVAAQLKARGIQLLLLPVPPKALLYHDKLLPDAAPATIEKPHAIRRGFIEQLEAADVTVIDLLPAFTELRKKGSEPYCRTDAHWSPAGIESAAEAIKLKLEQNKLRPDPTLKGKVTSENVELRIRGDLTELSSQHSAEREAVTIKRISAPEPAEENRSTILLFGDSHTLVFHDGGDMHTVNAGLIDALTGKLEVNIDLMGAWGSGVTSSRIDIYKKAKKDADFITSKKILIWCFAERELSQSQWKIIPIAPLE